MKTIKVIQQGNKFMVYFVNEKRLIESPLCPARFTQRQAEAKIQELNPDYYVSSISRSLNYEEASTNPTKVLAEARS